MMRIRRELVGSVTCDNCERSGQQDLEIQPKRPGLRISQVESDHIVEACATPAVHLPQTCHARLQFEYSAPMPVIVHFELVCNRRPRTYKRHLAAQNVPELRKLVETRLPQESAYSRHTWIVRKLIDCWLVAT